MILVSFDHFASSDFKIWLRSWLYNDYSSEIETSTKIVISWQQYDSAANVQNIVGHLLLPHTRVFGFFSTKISTRGGGVQLHVLYFLEYSPGLKLNPVLNWTLVNLLIQIEKFVFLSLDFNPLSIWTPGDYGPWNQLNPGA